jgi:hypothetical protein
MLKKSLIFGSAALLLVALITLTGCPTSADDGSSTTIVYGHRIYGTNVTPYQAQEAIDNAVAAGEAVVLEHELIIRPAGHLNFKNARVRINGRVRFDDGVMNMTDAEVSWASEATIDLGVTGFYIYREGLDLNGKVPADAWVWFAESPEGIRPTATAAAVREFRLGPKQNFDYSRGGAGVDIRTSATGLTTLFVLDNLAVPPEATPPEDTGAGGVLDLEITALGTVDVTGTVPSDVLFDEAYSVGTCATLTSSRGASVTAPDPGAPNWTRIPNVRVEEGKGITITQESPGPLWIEGKLTGSGTLTLATATNIRVNGGNGNLTVVTAVPNPARELLLYNTGTTAFSSALTINATSTITSGTVVFGGDLTVNARLTIDGDVILRNGQTITATDPIILGAGKTITLQITPQNSTQTISAPLLTAAGGDVVLDPQGAGATLTTDGPPRDTETAIAGNKVITLGGSGLEITNGTLQVLPNAKFTIGADLATRINGAAREFGYLAVANGGSLSVGNFVVDIGNTDVVIDGPFNFTAGGGTVTLGRFLIAGSATGTRLAAAGGSTGTITVNGGTLLLEELELDLSGNSSVTLSNGGDKVTLDKGAKLILAAGEGQSTTFAAPDITASTGIATLVGAFEGLTSDPTNTTRQPVLSVAHRGGELRQVDITATAAAPVVLGRAPKSNFTR